MTRRRTLLAAISAGTVGTAGCLGILGGGGTEETGEQETIADEDGDAATATPTMAPTTQVSTQETIEPSTEDGTESGTEATGTQVPEVDLNVIVDEVTECGRTCRTLAYTVQNLGGADAGDVTVEVTVRAPDASGDVVYEGTQNLGAIDSERQRSATTNLTFGEDGAATIRDNGGSVAIEMRALADDGTSETEVATETFEFRTATPAPTASTETFDVIVNEITKCGRTCRTLDYTVQNRGDQDLTGIEARVRVYTPDTDGDQVYDDTQEIGDLAAGTQVDATKDIDTGLSGGRKIQNNDGDIDIRVNLSSNEGVSAEFVFDEQLDV